ncbi:MAG: [Fe-Fe] hydrogenase large subunit C-terminal domain-containing protein [Clostridia bacterium]
MYIIDFKEANCKSCYKCLRGCPVKAISFINHKAQVIADKCILCGHCVSVCPQNAKKTICEIDTVKEMLQSGKKVFCTLAPSYISSFSNYKKGQLETALKQLGFADVFATAEGAKYVSENYIELLKSGKYKNLISSACPAVNRLIQYEYHDALKYLAPTDSPMIAHGKMLKEKFGDDIKIVFIGPCIAKKREAAESNIIDVALTFEDLEKWLQDAEIFPEKIDVKDFNGFSDKSLFYPIKRGIIKSFYEIPQNYDYFSVDGVEECKDVLSNINNLDGMFIEMSACNNSCINGPCSLLEKGSFVKANEIIRKNTKKNIEANTNVAVTNSKADIKADYPAKSTNKLMPTENEISDILKKIGKNSPKDYLNCGACGFNSCREKAIAVYNNEAILEMCVPYMRERAESFSTEIIKNSPNGIIAIDGDLKIIEFNDIAKAIYGITDTDLKDKYIVDYMNPSDYILVMNNIETIYNKKIFIDKTNKWAQISIKKTDNENVIISTIRDITKEVLFDEHIKKVKQETVETTNKVIEKQMNIVQEIASLLGETTADTKVALTKLKNAMTEEYNEK